MHRNGSSFTSEPPLEPCPRCLAVGRTIRHRYGLVCRGYSERGKRGLETYADPARIVPAVGLRIR